MSDPRPAWLRALSLALRAALALWAALELRARALVERVLRPRYQIRGQCRGDGLCCHHILVAEDALQRWPLLRRAARFWLCGVYRFRPTANVVELPDGGTARVYTCDALGADGRCREHLLRPFQCRAYPRPGYFAAPQLHRGCGFCVIDRRSGAQVQAAPPGPPPAPVEAYAPAALIARWRSGAGVALADEGRDFSA